MTTTTQSQTLAHQLATVADLNGFKVKDVARFDGVLRIHGIEPTHITDKVVHDAEKVFRAQVEATLAKYQKPTNEAVVEEEAPRKAAKRNGQVRVKIFDLPVTAILRWMGANGWDFDDAAVCLADHGAAKTSDSTIKIQLRAGKAHDASRGPIPELSRRQIRTLENSRK